jgi:hypothetical protein
MTTDTQMTAQQAQEYLAGGGVSCPFCGSQELDGKYYDLDWGRAYQKVTCQGCGRSWHDGYTLDSVGDDDGDGEFFYFQAPPSKLLQAAKCALADLEGLCATNGIDPDGDEPAALTMRELRKAIAAEGGDGE